MQMLEPECSLHNSAITLVLNLAWLKCSRPRLKHGQFAKSLSWGWGIGQQKQQQQMIKIIKMTLFEWVGEAHAFGSSRQIELLADFCLIKLKSIQPSHTQTPLTSTAWIKFQKRIRKSTTKGLNHDQRTGCQSCNGQFNQFFKSHLEPIVGPWTWLEGKEKKKLEPFKMRITFA